MPYDCSGFVSTEFYEKGGVRSTEVREVKVNGEWVATTGELTMYENAKWIGNRVGLGDGTVGFHWLVHPEEAMRRISEAGGATDAYGRNYTVQEFMTMLRGCARQEFDRGA